LQASDMEQRLKEAGLGVIASVWGSHQLPLVSCQREGFAPCCLAGAGRIPESFLRFPSITKKQWTILQLPHWHLTLRT